MVWSEQIGTSIILPANRVAGDGRNYIVIGEDVPSEITDRFTAAIIFRNGSNNVLPTSRSGSAFVYWVLGITTAGNLEIAFLYQSDVTGLGTLFEFRRSTIFAVNPPINNDPQSPAVVTLGFGNNGGYADQATEVQAVNVQTVIGPVTAVSQNFYSTVSTLWEDWSNADPTFRPVFLYKYPDGDVLISGMIRAKTLNAANGSTQVLGILPVGYRPKGPLILDTQASRQFAIVTINTNGRVIYDTGPTLAASTGYVQLNHRFSTLL